MSIFSWARETREVAMSLVVLVTLCYVGLVQNQTTKQVFIFIYMTPKKNKSKCFNITD